MMDRIVVLKRGCAAPGLNDACGPVTRTTTASVVAAFSYAAGFPGSAGAWNAGLPHRRSSAPPTTRTLIALPVRSMPCMMAPGRFLSTQFREPRRNGSPFPALTQQFLRHDELAVGDAAVVAGKVPWEKDPEALLREEPRESLEEDPVVEHPA